jgi:hypothetical protein
VAADNPQPVQVSKYDEDVRNHGLNVIISGAAADQLFEYALREYL